MVLPRARNQSWERIPQFRRTSERRTHLLSHSCHGDYRLVLPSKKQCGNVGPLCKGAQALWPWTSLLEKESQEKIQLRLALNAQKYLALHYLQQQEIRTSEMHSTRGNSYVYLLCLTAKGCKAAYKNTQNRESKRGNHSYRRDRIPLAREARRDCKFLTCEHRHSSLDLMANLFLPLPPPLTAVPLLHTCPYCTRLSVTQQGTCQFGAH